MRSEGGPPPPLRRLRRRLLPLLLLPLLAWAAYLLAANLLLNTPPLREGLNRRPERVRIEWSRAWTVWPGRVHVRGFTIRSQTERVQWWGTLEAASFGVDLPALARREFHARRLRGEGAAVRLRRRPPPEATAAEIAPLPPIPGLDLDAPPPEPRPPGRHPWTLRFDVARLRDVREVWIDRQRLVASGHPGGEAGGELEVITAGGTTTLTGAWLRWKGAELASGPLTLLRDADLTLKEVGLGPYVPREHRGVEALAFLSGTLEAGGEMPSLDTLNPYLPAAGLALVAGGGRLDTLLEISPDTFRGRLEIAGEGLEASFRRLPLRGALRLDARFASHRTPPEEIDLSGTHFRLESPAEDGRSWWAEVALPQGTLTSLRPLALDGVVELTLSDTAAPVDLLLAGRGEEGEERRRLPWYRHLLARQDVSGRARVRVDEAGVAVEDLALTGEGLEIRGRGRLSADGAPGVPPLEAALEVVGEVPDLSFLDAALAQTSLVSGIRGQASVRADLRLDEGALRPGSRVDLTARHLAARFLDFEAGGRGGVRGRVEEGPEGVTSEILIELEDVAVRRAGATTPHLRGPRLTLRATGRGEPTYGELPDPRVVFDLPEAEIPDLTVYNAYLPPAAGVALEAGGGRLRARFSGTRKEVEGEVEIAARRVLARARGVSVRGDLRLDARLSRGDPARRSFALDGTRLRLEGVELPGRSAASGWWLDLRLGEGRVEWSRPLDLRGALSLKMRDTRPLFALFAGARLREVGWIEKLFTIEDVSGRARLWSEPRGGVVFEGVEIEGEGLEVLARLRLPPAEGREDGALYARFRGLSAALALEAGERDWKLLRPRKWFEAQPPFPEPE